MRSTVNRSNIKGKVIDDSNFIGDPEVRKAVVRTVSGDPVTTKIKVEEKIRTDLEGNQKPFHFEKNQEEKKEVIKAEDDEEAERIKAELEKEKQDFVEVIEKIGTFVVNTEDKKDFRVEEVVFPKEEVFEEDQKVLKEDKEEELKEENDEGKRELVEVIVRTGTSEVNTEPKKDFINVEEVFLKEEVYEEDRKVVKEDRELEEEVLREVINFIKEVVEEGI